MKKFVFVLLVMITPIMAGSCVHLSQEQKDIYGGVIVGGVADGATDAAVAGIIVLFGDAIKDFIGYKKKEKVRCTDIPTSRPELRDFITKSATIKFCVPVEFDGGWPEYPNFPDGGSAVTVL